MNKSYSNKFDKEWFKERNRLLKIFKKLSFTIALVFFISSCSVNNKKNLTTYGTGLGVGTASWALTKSFLGKSGSSGNLPTVIAVTAIGTLLGTYWGSEIAENMYGAEDVQVIKASLEDEKEDTHEWTKQNSQGDIETLTVEKMNTFKKDNNTCKEFIVTKNVEGSISQITGTACQNSNGEWVSLGEDLL